jgi:uncharacterized Ntn-hydrolase superfamily protein
MTYSIVARDPATGELGAAVQTRWFAVGAGVLWAEAGVGAIATQSFAEIPHGPNGLARLRLGRSPADALRDLLDPDPDAAVRQVGIVDASGASTAHTGSGCIPAAGHLTAPDVAVQANMMERATVWPAMLAAFQAADGDLAARLMATLRAAEAEGGDVRGRQSAALLVVRASERPGETRFDLRIDDDRAPLDGLDRLLRLARAYEAFGEVERLTEAGDPDGAFAASVRMHELAPDDDQVTLWHAVSLVLHDEPDAARGLFAEAARAEPRAGEHLRRFAAAGQLPASDRVLETLLGEGPPS